jgi:hypothetical protein
MKELKDGWVKPFETKESIGKLTRVGNVEFGLIEEKDAYCHTHKMDYVNECHKSISGNIIWKGCPQCQSEQEEFTLMQKAKEAHQERMAKLNQSDPIKSDPIKRAKGF